MSWDLRVPPGGEAYAPSASLPALRRRAAVRQKLRAFFEARQVMEVDVPVIGDATVTDVFIESIGLQVNARDAFLQTSPEFYMKRLLAAGAGSIYYLGPAFRQDESGRHHRPEFTLLEWYRPGFDDRRLQAEVVDLLRSLAPEVAISALSYGAIFEQVLNLCPHSANCAQLERLAHQHLDFGFTLSTKSAYLDLLFSHCVQPKLPEGVTLVYDYPADLSALARLGQDALGGFAVAKRFEVFWDGLELANGYWELTDADEQRRRFTEDLAARRSQGLPQPKLDQRFLAGLAAGLPDCAGVALGLDRLLMCLSGATDLAQVMPFANR